MEFGQDMRQPSNCTTSTNNSFIREIIAQQLLNLSTCVWWCTHLMARRLQSPSCRIKIRQIKSEPARADYEYTTTRSFVQNNSAVGEKNSTQLAHRIENRNQNYSRKKTIQPAVGGKRLDHCLRSLLP
ncbi:hypothetical protein TNCV_3077931 [Trichonephila clavipes]|nr:hypothetical protein TNCV_3077931 [Trichonephila clavipes]